MATTVFVMTDKDVSPPQRGYVPLQVGAALGEDLGYLRDDGGSDQISELYSFFGPLTGIYWLWKNHPGQENIGICSPDEYFTEDVNGRVLSEEGYEQILKEAPVICKEPLICPSSCKETYEQEHYAKDLEAVGRSLAGLYPEDVWAWNEVLKEKRRQDSNACVMRRVCFEDYCEWMFRILMDAGQTIDPGRYEEEQRGVYGFLSKILLPVWMRARGVRAFYLPMTTSSEGTDAGGVLDEIRRILEGHETQRAWDLCREVMEKDPELIRSSSEEGNNLVIAEQVLYLKQLDEKDGHDSLWSQGWDLDTLMDHYRNIYSMMQLLSTGEELGEYEVEYLRQSGFNAMTADMMVRNDPADRLKKPPLKGDEIVMYLAKYNLF
ncbi:MAG: DUF4422 domain-containing protein [Lachnospiraceae bacterium]|nr:DUF4422 domain-containing protein [Lachnospiraceae bacterium]